MNIPLSIHVYPRGANGVPQTSGRADNLRGRITSYEHSITDRYGFYEMRCSFNATRAEALDWVRPDQLMRNAVVTSPKGKRVWDGLLFEVEVRIGRVTMALSLKDFANRVLVRYKNASNAGVEASTSYSDAASSALYGTKDRVHSRQTMSSTGAANFAQTALGICKGPISKHATESGTGSSNEISVTLRFMGRYGLLDWLLTSNSSTTATATNTQIAALLASYNSTNPFFSTTTTDMVATGVTDAETIDADSTYREKIEALLAQGNSAHQRLFWGVFDDGQFTVRVAACATPDTITYYESAKTGTITDTHGNVIEPWDVRPDAMVQVRDVLDSAPPAGSVDTATRKYVSKVSLRIESSGIRLSLEPDNIDSLEQLLDQPAGAGPAGTSSRQAQIERLTTQATRARFPAGDDPTRYSGGAWKGPAGGTGVVNPAGSTLTLPSAGTLHLGGGTISTGGGSIGNTGGSDIDLGTGAGIGGSGSSGVSTLSGTPGALTKWLTSSSLADAVAGVDYAAASHTHTAGQITSGILATARLGSGTASASTFLRGDSTWQAIGTIAPSAIGAAPDSATYIVQTPNSNLSNEQALSALATGLLKNTTTTGVLSIATAADLPNHASRHANGGADEIAIAASQITSGILATARLGSGTADATTFLRGDATWSTITPSAINAAPDSATYITQTPNGTLSNEQALSLLGTGLLKNTTTTGVLSIAGASDLPNHASRHANGGADEIAIAASQVTSGVFATARLGSGTAGAGTLLFGDSTWNTLAAGDIPNLPASKITSGIIAPGRLGSGTPSSATVLLGDSTWYALQAADVFAAPNDAKYIVQTANSGLANEQALGSLATGLLKNTTTTGVLSIATASDLPNHASRHANGGADELALAAGQITSGTIATARLGSGTASASTFLRGDQTWQAISTIAPSAIGAAPDDAKYIVQTANANLSNEFALGSLATGFLKVTTSTGALSSIADPLPPANGGTGVNNGSRTLTVLTNSGTLKFTGIGMTFEIAGDGVLDLNGQSVRFDSTGLGIVGGGNGGNIAIWTAHDTIAYNGYLNWDNDAAHLGIGIGASHTLHLGFDDAAKPSTSTWTVTSDIKAKDETSLQDFADGWDVLDGLGTPKIWRYTGEFGTEAGARGVGWVAHDVERVRPEWITKREERRDAMATEGPTETISKVNYHDLWFVYANILRDIKQRLEALERGPRSP